MDQSLLEMCSFKFLYKPTNRTANLLNTVADRSRQASHILPTAASVDIPPSVGKRSRNRRPGNPLYGCTVNASRTSQASQSSAESGSLSPPSRQPATPGWPSEPGLLPPPGQPTTSGQPSPPGHPTPLGQPTPPGQPSPPRQPALPGPPPDETSSGPSTFVPHDSPPPAAESSGSRTALPPSADNLPPPRPGTDMLHLHHFVHKIQHLLVQVSLGLQIKEESLGEFRADQEVHRADLQDT